MTPDLLPVGDRFYKSSGETRSDFVERMNELARTCEYTEIVQLDFDWYGKLYFQKYREVE